MAERVERDRRLGKVLLITCAIHLVAASPNIIIPVLALISGIGTARAIAIINMISATSEAFSCSLYLIIFVLVGQIFRQRLREILQHCKCISEKKPVNKRQENVVGKPKKAPQKSDVMSKDSKLTKLPSGDKTKSTALNKSDKHGSS